MSLPRKYIAEGIATAIMVGLRRRGCPVCDQNEHVVPCHLHAQNALYQSALDRMDRRDARLLREAAEFDAADDLGEEFTSSSMIVGRRSSCDSMRPLEALRKRKAS
jgi:hypothetical protein